MPGVTQDTEVPMPFMADFAKMFEIYPMLKPHPAECYIGDPSEETVAWGMAMYDAVRYPVYDSHRRLAMQLARDYKPGNIWLLHNYERLPYPYAIFYSVTGMLLTEEAAGRKCDWFFWMDDDVAVPMDIVRKLRAAADPEERPFVAAVGYDRLWPHEPSVWVRPDDALPMVPPTRMDPIPDSGVHKVYATGLCAALFHRSLFDKVSEPWFAIAPPIYDTQGGLTRSGINPDIWWSEMMHAAKLPLHICCDTEIIHLGKGLGVCRSTAETLRYQYRDTSVTMRDPAATKSGWSKPEVDEVKEQANVDGD